MEVPHPKTTKERLLDKAVLVVAGILIKSSMVHTRIGKSRIQGLSMVDAVPVPSIIVGSSSAIYHCLAVQGPSWIKTNVSRFDVCTYIQVQSHIFLYVLIN